MTETIKACMQNSEHCEADRKELAELRKLPYISEWQALQSKLAAARSEREELRETIRFMAQTIHQAHHQDSDGSFKECPKNTCDAARQALYK